jgi:uncharacterized protein
MKKVNLGIRLICPAYFVFLAVLLCWVAPACSAYPQPVSGKRVYDLASLLSPEQETQLEQLTSGVAEMTTAEFDIVTVSSLHGDSIEEYANDLFNEWAIGRADTNNGVLFLIAPNERKVRIEVGYGLEPLLTDGFCGDLINSIIIPFFKVKKFDKGIIIGAEHIAGFLQQHPEQAQGIKDSAPKFLRKLKRKMPNVAYLIPLCLGAFLIAVLQFVRSRKSYPFFLAIITAPAILFLIFLFYINIEPQMANRFHVNLTSFVTTGDMETAILFLGSFLALFPAIINIARWIRFRPRRCKQCGTQMVLASKKEKDSLLDDGEKKEEKIGSVEYDIWQCRSCNYHKKRKGKTTGQYKECPKCGYRTIEETIVRSATTSSTGLARMKCVYDACRHEYTTVIPKVTTSSSSDSSSSSSGGYSSGGSGSSGSSSSGGSSGGGGASGGW